MGAAGFLDRVFCTRLPDVGRVRLAYMLRPNGTVWSEATTARLGPDRYLLLGPTAARERDYDWLRRNLRPGEDVELRLGDRRAATFMVMGPASRRLLSRLCDDDLSRAAAPWMSARRITVAGVEATALRVSFVGELGWELHVDDADLVALYEALSEAGDDLGLSDFGSYALDSDRHPGLPRLRRGTARGRGHRFHHRHLRHRLPGNPPPPGHLRPRPPATPRVETRARSPVT